MSARPATRIDSQSQPARCPVLEAAHLALRNSPYWAIRHVRCSFHEGQLALHGQVPTFYLLQVAQELVCRLPGVEEIENRIVVDANPAPAAEPPAKSEPPSRSDSSRPDLKLLRRPRLLLSEMAVAARTA